MTEAWAASLLRAVILAVLCLCPAFILAGKIRSLSRWKKQLALCFVLFPMIVPPLLPAYAYSAFSFNFQTQPFWNEVLYSVTTAFRALPPAVLIYLLLPDPVSPSSLLCSNLIEGPNPLPKRIRYQKDILAFCLLFLLIFHEYEMASLMRVKHWTVVIFNAHAGGLSQSPADSLRLASQPLITSAVFLTAGIKLITRSVQSSFSKKEPVKRLIPFSLIFLSMSIVFIYPLGRVLWGAMGGFSSVFEGRWMHNELLNSFLFSSVATVCCWFLSRFLIDHLRKVWAVSAILIPGLTGSLILGLGLLSVFTLPGLNRLANTAVPLSIGLILYGLPLAVLMQIVRKNLAGESAVHSAELLPESNRKKLLWIIKRLPAILFILPVFCYIWFDLTLSSMLAPASMPGIFPRLYNLMHYNENEKLSATVFIVVFIPLITAAVAVLLSRMLPVRKY